MERENEKLKGQLARLQKKSSRPDPVDEDVPGAVLATIGNGKSGTSLVSPSSSVGTMGEVVCEICERPGHDLFGCDLLNKNGAMNGVITSSLSQDDLFCEDCEERGHSAANCPHSLEVF